MAHTQGDSDRPAGLRADAIGFVDALVIGLNSTSRRTRWRRSSAPSSPWWACTPRG